MQQIFAQFDEFFTFAQEHVFIARHARRFFPSERMCSGRLTTFRRSGWLRAHGRVAISQRWPTHYAYCNGWTPSAASLAHDVAITDFWEAFAQSLPFTCNPQLLNEHLLPDAEMTLPAGVLLYLEMDMGSEPLSTIRLKQTRYAAVCNPKKGPFVLYVTLGERRLRNLMTAAGTSATFTYFATLSTVLEHKTKSAFTRSDGQRFFFFPKDR